MHGAERVRQGNQFVYRSVRILEDDGIDTEYLATCAWMMFPSQSEKGDDVCRKNDDLFVGSAGRRADVDPKTITTR